jgi:site-specific DNA recombinase
VNRPIRQDYLDDVVWKQVMQLFEDPDLIRNEINRRIQEARNSNPAKARKETLVNEMARIKNGIDRLLDAYQEGLVQLPELRGRVHGLRKRESALTSELQSIESRMVDEEMYLQLVGRIDDFLSMFVNPQKVSTYWIARRFSGSSLRKSWSVETR